MQTFDHKVQPLNSWQQQYEEITKSYLDAIPLAQEPKACFDWRHGITVEQSHPYEIDYCGF